jgi:hypothetical protein
LKLKKISRPNSYQCEGCPDWDDVNGCWADVEDVDSCDKINDEGYYSIGEDEDEEE